MRERSRLHRRPGAVAVSRLSPIPSCHPPPPLRTATPRARGAAPGAAAPTRAPRHDPAGCHRTRGPGLSVPPSPPPPVPAGASHRAELIPRLQLSPAQLRERARRAGTGGGAGGTGHSRREFTKHPAGMGGGDAPSPPCHRSRGGGDVTRRLRLRCLTWQVSPRRGGSARPGPAGGTAAAPVGSGEGGVGGLETPPQLHARGSATVEASAGAPSPP